MFAVATWAKIALAIVSFGSAAGGTYLVKSSSYGTNSVNSTEKQWLSPRDDEKVYVTGNNGQLALSNPENPSITDSRDTSTLSRGANGSRGNGKKTFGKIGQDSDINGEYILSGGDNSEGDICMTISKGADGEKCNSTISSKVSEIEKSGKKFRLWLKTENKEHAGYVLKGLGFENKGNNEDANKWFESKDSIEVTLNFDTLTCQLTDKTTSSTEVKEVNVSCFNKQEGVTT
ncbi:hypothetical protein [Mycoplasma suis]|uniref:Uncharacterized protein n=1 Tax=Mycoplasma suis (strain Illinois) TaxID=768700 RepID=F0QQ69_MYCSL|nr:hypothetical protein [Mycoplasma suis]ADX97639.1 hypothetical protein MSU_0095 [Mycoplasma suis str. Illinois]